MSVPNKAQNLVVKRSDIRVKTVTMLVWVCPLCGRELTYDKLAMLVAAIKKHVRRKHGLEAEFNWNE